MFLLSAAPTPYHPPSGTRVGPWTLRAGLARETFGAGYVGTDGGGRVVELRELFDVVPVLSFAPFEPTLTVPGVCFWREHVPEARARPDATWVRADWVAGVPLGRTYGARFEPPPPALGARLIADAALAVAGLHAHGRLHGGLRRDRILVHLPEAPEPGVSVVDPGANALAGRLEQSHHALARYFRHLSPAQVKGEPARDADDVWALGLHLWELIAQRPLFAGSAPEQLSAIAALDAVPHPGGESTAGALAVAALCPDPAGRPTAAELAASIAAHAAPPDALRAWCGERYPQERSTVRALLAGC